MQQKSVPVLFLIAGLAVLLSAAAPTPPASASGRVRDIDYSAKATQVIVDGGSASTEFVGLVTDERLQEVLESAFVSQRSVDVRHSGMAITGVTLTGAPTLCSAAGCVETLSCSASRCEATISGHTGTVTTTSVRALGILLTAVNNRSSVSELATDAKGRITRVKVNRS